MRPILPTPTARFPRSAPVERRTRWTEQRAASSLARACFVSAILAAVALAPREAAAGDAPGAADASSARHLIALHVEGAGAGDLDERIRKLLPETVDLVPTKDLSLALAKRGQKLPYGLVISVDQKRGPALGRTSKALEALGAEALVVAFVRPRKQGGREALLLVLEPGKDAPTVEQVVPLGGEELDGALAEALRDPLAAWAPPPPPPEDPTPAEADGAADEAPAADEADTRDDASEAERLAHVVGHDLVSVEASFDLAGRFFDYNDGLTTNLRSYDTLATAVSGRLEVHPLASTGLAVLEGLGVYGEVRGAIGLSSEAPDGTEVGTTWLRLGGGLRLRLPLGDREAPFVVAARGGLVHESFSLDASGALAAEVPSVGYTFVRGGLDARIPLGPVAVLLEAGYLGALDAGELASRFRDPTLGGIDLGGGLAVPIAWGFEGRLRGQYVRWFYAFAPTPGDAYVAGGALDEYMHVELGPAYVY